MFFLFKICLSVIASVLALAWIAWRQLANEEIPNLSTIEEVANKHFDYIIVGAGTFGSVLANRLSENENISVLLIEAGSTFSPISIVPFLAIFLQQTANDWAFVSVSQKYSSKGSVNQIQYLPRGKGLGGSSQLNYMLHFDGLAEDFEQWEHNGATGWNYKTMSKYLDKQHVLETPAATENTSKPCNIFSHNSENVCNLLETPKKSATIPTTTINGEYSKLADVFNSAKMELCKGDSKIIFRSAKTNTVNGTRYNTYQNYLRPCFNRTNLRIVMNGRVKKINILKNEAVSVDVAEESSLKRVHKAFATNEIILSTGSYQTPQLLKLSGIGPAGELKAFNITPLVDAPNVGRNLYDHMNLPIYVSINESMSITKTKMFSFGELLKYLQNGEGIFSQFGVIGFVGETDEPTSVGIFGIGSIDEDALRDISNCKVDVFRSLFPLHHNASQEGFVLLNSCNQPKSRGVVRLTSRNIKVPPLIDPNYLQHKDDISCLIKSVRLAVRVMETDTFKKIGAKIHWPRLRECMKFGPSRIDIETNQPSDQYVECLARQVAITTHHPGGTCAMGSKATEAPLDARLRVRGVERLRVADASVLPTPISGTPNSVLVGVAERAADIILEDRE